MSEYYPTTANPSASVQLCGSTELRLEQQIISWNIRGASALFQTKLLPVWKIKSPTFTTSSSSQSWHLELVQSKNEFVKCILVQEAAAEESAPARSSEETTSFPITSAVSEMLQTASTMEVTSGAIVNNVFLLTRDGHLESFPDIVAKYEETNGWREWAGKFVEKRRKSGLTEYIFGRDCEAYENALPLTYVSDNQERFVDSEDILHLQAELVFTRAIDIPVPTLLENNEAVSSVTSQRIINNEHLAQRLADYYNNKNYSDVTLIAGDQTFQVHKIILEARAPRLAACIFSGSKSSEKSNPTAAAIDAEKGDAATAVPSSAGDERCKETCPETITIDHMSPNVLQAILRFIYSGSVPANDPDTLTNVFREARKYDFHELAYSCILKTLELFYSAPAELKPFIKEGLKEMFLSCDDAVFENRILKLDELYRLHPAALQTISFPFQSRG